MDLTSVQRQRFGFADGVQPCFGESTIYETEIDNVRFEFFGHLKEASPYLFVFGPAAVDREKHAPPVFHRWSWAEKLPYSVLVINDPTLYMGPLRIAWCLGTQDTDFTVKIVEVLSLFVRSLGLDNRRVLFYGSSAGGFTSLMMAGHLTGASALVEMPQTDVLRHNPERVAELLEACFGGIDAETARQRFATRLSVAEYFRTLRSLPNVYYVQNAQDVYHVREHMMPFFNVLGTLMLERPEFRRAKVHLELHYAEGGHVVVPYQQSMKHLDRARRWFLEEPGNGS